MNESLALIGILLVAYVFLAPLVIIIMAVRNRRRIRSVEVVSESLQKRIQSLEAWKGEEHAVPPAPGAPAVQPVPIVEHKPVVPPTEPTLGQEPVVEAFPKPPQPLEAKKPEPVFQSSLVPEAVPAAVPEEEPPIWGVAAAVQDFLAGIGMWPPGSDSGRDRETMLMQWWLPRIGGMLALLSALFFGVYINQSTSPVFKCLELVGVSLAIAGVGRFMERHYATFGGVVMVTGLVMLYLTSVAAYILPATRVIENPLVGALVQVTVLAFICVVGFLRRSEGIVVLAFCFGLFLGVFMAWEGLREGALIAAIFLFGAGLLLSRIPCFRRLIWIITPGSFLVALAFPAIGLTGPVEIPGSVSMQVFLNVVFAGVVASYFAGTLGKGFQARLLQSIASSLAIIATLWFFRSYYPDALEWAALILGINMLVGAIIAWNVRGCGFLAQLLFIKASFLIAVWALLHYSGDLRWMVLALETVVLAASARRSKRMALELATWAIAGVSYLFFSGVLLSTVAYASFIWWMAMLYPVVILLAMAYQLPAFYVPGIALRELSRKWAYGLLSAMAVFIWYKLGLLTSARPYDAALPFVFLLYAFGALSFVSVLMRWLLQMTAALGFVVASVLFCSEPYSLMILVALLAASVVALLKVTQSEDKVAIAVENSVYVLSLVPLALWILQILDNWPGQAIIAFGLSIGVLFLGWVPRLRQAGSWSFIPLLVFMLTEYSLPTAGMWNLTAVAAGLGWMAIPVLMPGVRDGLGWAKKGELWSLIGALMLWWYVVFLGDTEATWMMKQMMVGSLAIVFLVASSRWKISGYFIAAMLFLVPLMGRHALTTFGELSYYVPWKSEVLLSGGILYAFSLVWFFLKPLPYPFVLDSRKEGFLRVSTGIAAIIFFNTSVVTFSYEGLGWMSWYTPILAVTAFFMIILGLFRNDQVFRRLGLIALTVPLVRLFVIDVQDVLHRIIAFAAAAILLTVLGYLYHRLSARLGED